MSKPIKPKKAEDQEIFEKVAHSIHIAEAMNECLWLGDKNHKTIYVNPVYEKTSGYSLKECIGKPSDFCFDEESKRTIAQHHKLRKKGVASQYEATMVSKTGKKTPLLVSGAPTSAGGTIGIFINLTKVKELTRTERLTEQIIKHSTEAIVVLNKKSRITMWSAGATKIFGYKEKDVLNKKLSNLVIPPEEQENNKSLIAEVEKKKYIKNIETKRMTKNGNVIDVSVSVTRVTDSKNGLIGYLVIYRDITHQKRINSELQRRFEAIQDAYKELGLQKRQSDYIYEIIDLATSANNVGSLSKLIVSAACMLTKCDSAVLRIFEKNTNRLKLRACLGVSNKWLDKSTISLKNSLAEDAFKNKRPIILQDIDTSDKHKGVKLLKEHKFKTLILIPFIVNNKLIGTLSLYATDPGKFRLIETEFLERFAKQCSLALYAKTNEESEPGRKHSSIKIPSSKKIKEASKK